MFVLGLGLIGVACDAGYTTVPGLPDTDASADTVSDAGGGIEVDATVAAPKDAGPPPVDASFDAGPPCPIGQDFSMDPQNCGVCRHVCNLGGDCVAGECKRVAFVAVPNNGGGGGNLGGLAGADAICQTAAAQAGLRNTFRAWLAVSKSGPLDRFVRSARPYVLPSKVEIAPSFAGLTTGAGIEHAINEDAAGQPTTVTRAWTNVNGNGAAISGSNTGCLAWTSNATGERATWGNTLGNGNGWSTNGDDSCLGGAHGLYCFEQ
jgi:hypothetical protein